MSGRKNNPIQYPTIVNTSAAAPITSAVSSIRFLDDVGYQFNFTLTPTGSFQIQISADHEQDEFGNVTVPGNWVPVTLTYFNGSTFVSGSSVPASVGSPIYVDLPLLSAPWIRANYSGGGTGVINAFFVAKMV